MGRDRGHSKPRGRKAVATAVPPPITENPTLSDPPTKPSDCCAEPDPEMSAATSGVEPRDPHSTLVASNDNHPLTLAQSDLRLIICALMRRREALGGWADCVEAIAIKDLLGRLSPAAND